MTWFTNFKKLLGETPDVEEPDEEIPNIFEDLDINDEPFTLDEFRKVKTSLKLGKAAGPDNIPPEVFKCCDFDEICLQFCNDALTKNDKPDLWSFMNIIPVPKSGDLSNTNNYRGISLICIVAKIYNRMILNRIRSVIDLKLRINQNGFRPGRSTVAQILTLRRIIEGVKANNLSAVITFRLQEGLRLYPSSEDDENSEGIWHTTKSAQSDRKNVHQHQGTDHDTRWGDGAV